MTTETTAGSATLTAEDADNVQLWSLTARERAVYEAGFLMGYAMREREVEQAQHDADRYYRAAFDHEHHDCRVHAPTTRRHNRR